MGGLGVVLAAIALGPGACAVAADPPPCGGTGLLSGAGALTCTYTVVGSDVFTVPAGVTSAEFAVVGAAGGHYFIDGDVSHPDPGGILTGRPGGAGGESTGTISLTAGQVLQIDVAGRGANGTAANRSGGMANGPTGGVGGLGGFGGSNGGVAGGPGDAGGAGGGSTVTPGGDGGNGSGGGGASDVRLAPGGCASLNCPIGAVLLVAAGGGGGGGTGGQGNAFGGAGGAGGGAAGADGGAKIDGGNAGAFGRGATDAAAGAGGLEPLLHAPGADPTDPRYGGDGASGAAGAGGVGGAGNRPCPTGVVLTPPCTGGPNSGGGGTSGGGAGGGGGGGLFGGGGGSGGGGLSGGGGGAGGGGGGGSSFAAAGVAGPVLTAGVNCDPTPAVPCGPTLDAGNGEVTITWTTAASVATTTALATGPASPVTNQTVTLTATVTAATGTPSGTVEFDNHHAAVPGCGAVPVTAAGTAVCPLPVSAGQSPYGLNASFVPAAGTTELGSTSPPVRVVVGLDPTTTALAVSSPSLAAGASATYTATVAPADAGALAPTGAVEFLDAGAAIAACASQPLSAGLSATCPVSYASGGAHAITAAYLADTDFAGSSSAAQTVTVAAATTAVPTGGGSSGGSGTPGAPGPAPTPGSPPSPGPAPPTVGVAHAASAKVSGTTASLLVSCTGAAGTSCAITVTLTVVETVTGGRVTAVSAAARKRTVTLGTAKVTLAVGHSAPVRVKLTAPGRRLLAARHRLRVKLTASSRTRTGGSAVARTQTVSFRAK